VYKCEALCRKVSDLDSNNDILWYKHNCEQQKKSDYNGLNDTFIWELIWGLKVQTQLYVIWVFPIFLDAYTELYPPNIK
jgi:hypothetical protein